MGQALHGMRATFPYWTREMGLTSSVCCLLIETACMAATLTCRLGAPSRAANCSVHAGTLTGPDKAELRTSMRPWVAVAGLAAALQGMGAHSRSAAAEGAVPAGRLSSIVLQHCYTA